MIRIAGISSKKKKKKEKQKEEKKSSFYLCDVVLLIYETEERWEGHSCPGDGSEII